MLETVETHKDAAAVVIGFETFVIAPNTMCPISNITR